MNVLIVEDNPSLANAVAEVLRANKYLATVVVSGAEALSKLAGSQFAAIVMDLGLPDMDGVDLCKQVRAKGINTPILMLTARIDLASKVGGLDAGADDYLCKPFLMQELLARIRALTRREAPAKSPQITLNNNIVIDTNKMVVYNQANKTVEVKLTPTELRLLLYLAGKRGTVVSAIELYENVWNSEGDELYFSDALKVNIARLRKKVGADVIKTVAGFGYLVD